MNYPLYCHGVPRDTGASFLQTKEKLQEFDEIDLCKGNLYTIQHYVRRIIVSDFKLHV